MMRAAIALCVLSLVLAACPRDVDALAARASTAESAPPSRRGLDEVRALLVEQVAAWNRGDLEGFCAPYADDARFVTPKGVTTGRAEILARYDRRYRAEGKEMGQLSLDVESAREVGEGGATVVMRWGLTFSSGEAASGYSLIALERRDGGWIITEDASM